MANFTFFIFLITLAFVGKCSGTSTNEALQTMPSLVNSQNSEEDLGWEIFNDHLSVVRNQKTNDYLPDFL
jgi:hypothetical protein